MRENEGKLGIFPSKINGRFCFLGFFLNDLLLVLFDFVLFGYRENGGGR